MLNCQEQKIKNYPILTFEMKRNVREYKIDMLQDDSETDRKRNMLKKEITFPNEEHCRPEFNLLIDELYEDQISFYIHKILRQLRLFKP